MAVYDLEKAYALKIRTDKMLKEVGRRVLDKITKFRCLGGPTIICIEGIWYVLTSSYVSIYRCINRKEIEWCEEHPWRRAARRKAIAWEDDKPTPATFPYWLRLLKYLSGSYVQLQASADPDYINGLREMFDEIKDINAAVRELRRL